MLNGKKILISSCAGLGDLLMFTPALRRIKEMYPSCQITFMTNQPHKDVLSGLSYIDKVVTIQRKKLFGRLRLLPVLLQQDYVIFTDWQPQLLVASYLFGVKRRIGIPKPGHSLNRYFTKELRRHVLETPDYAAVTNALIFSEALDITLDGDMTHYDISQPTERDEAAVDKLLVEVGLSPMTPFICLAPFTGMEERNWPLEHVSDFIKKVKDRYGASLPVVLIGPPGKAEAAVGLDVKSLVGKTSILEMVALIRRAALFIGPDSGPMHIAGAVHTPLIAMFSKDLPSRWAPRYHCSVITLNMPCSPCSDAVARQCPTVACMREITADMVLAKTIEILK